MVMINSLVIAERNFVPVPIIEQGAAIVVVIVVIGVLYKFNIWRKTIPKGFISNAKKGLGIGRLVRLFFSELGNRVALQRDVITDSRVRWATHLMIFWGFWGLVFATTWTYIFYRDGTPRPLDDPGKIAGNIGGALVLAGCTIILARYALYEKYRKGARGDITFFSFLYLATITGFASEFARFNSGATTLYAVYAVHLFFIIGLLAAAPFTHFLHAILVPFERYVGRIQSELMKREIPPSQDARKEAMIASAVSIKEGNEDPVYPEWLRSNKKKDEKQNTS